MSDRAYVVTVVDEIGGSTHPRTMVQVRHEDGRELTFWLDGWGVDAGTIHETAARMLAAVPYGGGIIAPL